MECQWLWGEGTDKPAGALALVPEIHIHAKQLQGWSLEPGTHGAAAELGLEHGCACTEGHQVEICSAGPLTSHSSVVWGMCRAVGVGSPDLGQPNSISFCVRGSRVSFPRHLQQ